MLRDISATVVWNGAFNYYLGKDTLQAGLHFDESALAVYIGLMFPHVWRNRKSAMKAFLGLASLLVIDATGVAILGVIGMVSDFSTAQTFMYMSSSVSLALPIVFYWMVTGLPKKVC